MYRLELVTTIEKLEIWQEFIDSSIKDQMITIAYNPSLTFILAKTFGYKPESYLIKEQGKVIGLFPGVRIGNKYVSLPHFSYGGPIFNNKNLEQKQIDEFLPEQNFDIRSFNKLSKYSNNEKVICYLKLVNTAEEQWRSFKSKLRSQIKKGQTYGLEVFNGKDELLLDFYGVYSRNMFRLGSPPLPKVFFKNILNYYKYGNVNITVIKYNNIAVAAGMTLSYMGFTEVSWASADYEFNKYNANMVLYWEMIKKSIIEDCRTFSFGRSSKNSNTLKFKLQWQPEIIPMYFNYSHQHTFNIKRMNLLSKIWKIQSLKSSIFFGGIISKYLY